MWKYRNYAMQRLKNLSSRWNSSNSKSNPQDVIRNIGILAHIDSGMKVFFSDFSDLIGLCFRQDNNYRTNAFLFWKNKQSW